MTYRTRIYYTDEKKSLRRIIHVYQVNTKA